MVDRKRANLVKFGRFEDVGWMALLEGSLWCMVRRRRGLES